MAVVQVQCRCERFVRTPLIFVARLVLVIHYRCSNTFFNRGNRKRSFFLFSRQIFCYGFHPRRKTNSNKIQRNLPLDVSHTRYHQDLTEWSVTRQYSIGTSVRQYISLCTCLWWKYSLLEIRIFSYECTRPRKTERKNEISYMYNWTGLNVIKFARTTILNNFPALEAIFIRERG